MFRINVYTERDERRRAQRRGMVQLGVFATVLGINALMVAFLLVSGGLLRDRQEAIGREVQRIRGQAGDRSVPTATVTLARTMFGIRRERIDWAPMLAAVGTAIPPELVLEELQASATQKRTAARLEIVGGTHDKEADMQGVSNFIAALRVDARVTDRLPEVKLGTMNNGTGGFQLICEPKDQ